jgi:hypothetical protein
MKKALFLIEIDNMRIKNRILQISIPALFLMLCVSIPIFGAMPQMNWGQATVGGSPHVWVKNFSGNTFGNSTSGNFFFDWKMTDSGTALSNRTNCGEMWFFSSSVINPGVNLDTNTNINQLPGYDAVHGYSNYTLGQMGFMLTGTSAYMQTAKNVNSPFTYTIAESSSVRVRLNLGARILNSTTDSVIVYTRWTIYPTGQIFKWDSVSHKSSSNFSWAVAGFYLDSLNMPTNIIPAPKSKLRGGSSSTMVHDFVAAISGFRNSTMIYIQPFDKDTITLIGTGSIRNGFEFNDETDNPNTKWGSLPVQIASYIDIQRQPISSAYVDSIGDFVQHWDYGADATKSALTILNGKGTLQKHTWGDIDTNGFSEGEGAYIIQANNNTVQFTLLANNGGSNDTSCRFNPAFRITSYTYPTVPQYVIVGGSLLTPGTDYNVALRDTLYHEALLQLNGTFCVNTNVYIATGGARTWLGNAVNGNWNNASNWSGSVIPGPSDTVIFNNTSTANCTLAVNDTVKSIVFANNYTGAFNFNGKILTIAGDADFRSSGNFFKLGNDTIKMNPTGPANFFPKMGAMFPAIQIMGSGNVVVKQGVLRTPKLFLSGAGVTTMDTSFNIDTIQVGGSATIDFGSKPAVSDTIVTITGGGTINFDQPTVCVKGDFNLQSFISVLPGNSEIKFIGATLQNFYPDPVITHAAIGQYGGGGTTVQSNSFKANMLDLYSGTFNIGTGLIDSIGSLNAVSGSLNLGTSTLRIGGSNVNFDNLSSVTTGGPGTVLEFTGNSGQQTFTPKAGYPFSVIKQTGTGGTKITGKPFVAQKLMVTTSTVVFDTSAKVDTITVSPSATMDFGTKYLGFSDTVTTITGSGTLNFDYPIICVKGDLSLSAFTSVLQSGPGEIKFISGTTQNFTPNPNAVMAALGEYGGGTTTILSNGIKTSMLDLFSGTLSFGSTLTDSIGNLNVVSGGINMGSSIFKVGGTSIDFSNMTSLTVGTGILDFTGNSGQQTFTPKAGIPFSTVRQMGTGGTKITGKPFRAQKLMVNASTVVFDTVARVDTITVSGSATMDFGTKYMFLGDTVTNINGTGNLYLNQPTIYVIGDLNLSTFASVTQSATGIIKFMGATAQNFTPKAGVNLVSISQNSPSSTNVLTNGFKVNFLDLTAGTLNLGAGLVDSVGDMTVSGGNLNIGTSTLKLGGTNVNFNNLPTLTASPGSVVEFTGNSGQQTFTPKWNYSLSIIKQTGSGGTKITGQPFHAQKLMVNSSTVLFDTAAKVDTITVNTGAIMDFGTKYNGFSDTVTTITGTGSLSLNNPWICVMGDLNLSPFSAVSQSVNGQLKFAGANPQNFTPKLGVILNYVQQVGSGGTTVLANGFKTNTLDLYAYTLNLGAGLVDSTGSVAVFAGSLTMGSSTLKIGASSVNFNGLSSLTPGTGALEFTATGTQTFTPKNSTSHPAVNHTGSGTFQLSGYPLTCASFSNSAGPLDFNGQDITTGTNGNFTITNGTSSTISNLDGRTITTGGTGNVSFTGQSGSYLNLNPNTGWSVHAGGTLNATYATIKNSNASGSSGWGVGTNCTDATGNTHWDLAPPTSNIANPAPGYIGTLPSITGTASDGSGSGVTTVQVSIYNQTDGSYWQGSSWAGANTWVTASGATSWSYSGTSWTSGKTYIIKSEATDAVGNTETPGSGVTITYDATPPTSSITAPINGSALNSLAAIAGTATDGTGSGVLNVKVSIYNQTDVTYWNGAVWDVSPTWVNASGASSWTFADPGWQNGKVYVIQSKARDMVSNDETPGIGNTFLFDNSAPVVPSNTITVPNGGEAWAGGASHLITWNNGSITDALLKNNPIALRYSTDGGATFPNLIATNLMNTGTYSWTVPAQNSSSVRVRIEVQDSAGNNLSYDTSNANFTIDNTSPTVTINQKSGQADPTNGSSILFTVVFSEPVTGFSMGGVGLSGTAPGNSVSNVVEVSPLNGTTYEVTVSGMSGSGTVIASVNASAATDLAGNPNAASTSTDNTVTFDNTPPTVTLNQKSGQADPTNGSPILFTAVFSKPVTGFSTTGVGLTGTATGKSVSSVVEVSPLNGTTYEVTVSGMSASGTVIASVNASAAIDAAGNANSASTSTDNTVTFDNTPPSVTINQKSGQADPTNGSLILYTVVFSEPVTGFGVSGVFLSGTATGKSVSSALEVSPMNGTTYEVTVSGMSGSGTVIASVNASAATDLAGNANTASTSTDNTVTFDNVPPVVSNSALTSPNGGEVWTGGSSHSITWNYLSITDAMLKNNPVSLYYSTDGGTTFPNLIAAGLSNSGGTYSWTVPAINSSMVRVRIEVQDSVGNISYDTSNANFVIDNSPPVVSNSTLTSPNGGEVWAGGSSHSITWNSGSITDALLKNNPISLLYSTDGGATFSIIGTGLANSGTYPWTIPSENSASVRVRIEVHDSVGNISSDTSNANFTIDNSPPVVSNSTLTSPNGGEVWGAGSMITWNNASITDAMLKNNPITLSYSTDGGITFPNVIASALANNGTYLWNTPPLLISSTVRVRIAVQDSVGNISADTSNANFTIDNSPPVVLNSALTSPNGGEIWAGGSSHSITWNYLSITDAMLKNNPVSLYYSTDGGTTFPNLIAAGLSNSGGTYLWTVPATNSGTVRVRIAVQDSVGNISADTSNANFVIDNGAPVVSSSTLTSPNGGEVWGAGSSHSITWNSGSITDALLKNDPVTLSYSTDGGVTFSNTIATKLQNSGTYPWTVPSVSSSTIRVRIAVQDSVGNISYDTSNANFAIDNTPPVSSIAAPLNGAKINTLAAISGSANDAGSGVSLVQVAIQKISAGQYWTGSAWGGSITWLGATGTLSWSYNATGIGMTAGTYTVQSRATDAAGNVETPSSGFTFAFDSSAPVSSITLPANNGCYANLFSIAGIAGDAGCGVCSVTVALCNQTDNLYYNGSAWSGSVPVWLKAGGTSTWTLSPATWTNGKTYNIKTRAIDSAGNVETPGGGNTFTLDQTPPVSAVTAPSGSFADSASVLGGTAADPAGCGIASVKLSIRNQTDNIYYNGSTWNITDPGYVCAATGTTAWTYPALSWLNGKTYIVKSQATDLAGNTETPGAGKSFTIDNSPPVSSISAPADKSISASVTTISGTATDALSGVSQVQITIMRVSDTKYWNGSVWGGIFWLNATGTSTWTFNATGAFTASGAYTVQSRATDVAGNVETPGAGISFTVDNVPPVAVITFPAANSRINTAPVITGTAVDAVSGTSMVSVSLYDSTAGKYYSGSGWAATDPGWVLTASGTAAWNYSCPVLTSGHVYSAKVRATDLAGNVSSIASVIFTFDNTAPAVTVNQAQGQADPASALPIHFTAAFSEPVTGFAASSVSLGGSATGAKVMAIAQLAPNDSTVFDVAVDSVKTSGTVIAVIKAQSASDLAGNPCVASTSTDDTVTFGYRPRITIIRADTLRIAGDTAVFMASIAGTRPVTWQWQKNGASITGATDSSYVVGPVSFPDSGSQYRCVVSNAFGSDTSASTMLCVLKKVHASFAAAPLSGAAPFTVAFVDSSTGIITSRLWNFGDNTTDTAKIPGHTYVHRGVYSVKLVVLGPAGRDSSVKASYISVADTTPPLPVTTLRVTAPAAGKAIVSWTPSTSSDAESLAVCVGVNAVPQSRTIGAFGRTMLAAAASDSITGLPADGSKLFASVYAMDSSGNWSLPAVDSVKLSDTVPPANNCIVTLASVGDTAIRVSWSVDKALAGDAAFVLFGYARFALVPATMPYPYRDTSFVVGPVTVPGLWRVSTSVADAAGNSLPARFDTITIKPLNTLPVLSSWSLPDSVWADSLAGGQLAVSDTDAIDSITLTWSAKPSWVTVVPRLRTPAGIYSFVIAGRPSEADTGWNRLAVGVSDKSGHGFMVNDSVFVKANPKAPVVVIHTDQTRLLNAAARFVLGTQNARDSGVTYEVTLRALDDTSYVRRITSSGGVVDLYPLSDGRYELFVTATSAKGLKDTIGLRDTFTIKGATTHQFVGPVDTTVTSWQMVSFPTRTMNIPSSSPLSTLYHWDELAGEREIYGYYHRVSETGQILPGFGYWRKATDTNTVVIPRSNVLDSVVTITLYKGDMGWNQIASPFPYPVVWPYPGILWQWNDSTHDFMEADSVLRPWQGYWVMTDSTMTVRLTNRPLFEQISMAKKNVAKFTDKNNWQVRVKLTGASNTDAENIFGFSAAARNGYDANDAAKPPRMSDYQYMFFSHPEWKRGCNEYARDIRRTLNRVEAYTIGITPGSGKQAPVISFVGCAKVSPSVLFYLAGEKDLIQIEEGKTYPIEKSSKVLYKTLFVTTDKNFLRNFPRSFNLGLPYPNPTRRMATIQYSLPYHIGQPGVSAIDPYKVGIALYDVMGRQVRQLVSTMKEPGNYSVSWDGKNNAGLYVAAGMYFCRMNAAGTFESVKRISVIR